MGSGKGKLDQKFAQLYPGQRVLTFKNIRRQPAELVQKFFKKSALGLKLVYQKC